MSYRSIWLSLSGAQYEDVKDLCADAPLLGLSAAQSTDEHILAHLVVRTPDVQDLTDKIQSKLGKNGYYIAISDLESVLPRQDEEAARAAKDKKKFLGISRDELYENVARNASVDRTFILLVVFSTIVAAIGLLEDNIAVTIGAMVIAPLLGPNLSLALASTLGDMKLIKKAIASNIVGVLITLSLSVSIGFFWEHYNQSFSSYELLGRTEVGFDSIALAIAAGAAAVLSLTTGLSSVLVGVMVAVALLPPAVTLGIMLGAQKLDLAVGAGLLLCVNIVCVNLAAKTVFLVKGIKPRTWYEKQKAKRASRRAFVMWATSLMLLATIIYIRSNY